MNLKHYKLAITPLSPIHLGSNDDYEPTSYVIDDGVLYEFDALSALAALPEQFGGQLNKIVSRQPYEAMLTDVQALFYRHKDDLAAIARRMVKVSRGMQGFYEKRIGKTTHIETTGSKHQNKLKFAKTAFNPVSNLPYVTGSGLKGAIRTAILDAENSGRFLPQDLRNEKDKYKSGVLQKRLLDGSFSTDPFRLVQLGDAALVSKKYTTEVKFALNKKKQPVKDEHGNLRESMASKKLNQLLECLSPLQPRVFIGSIAVDESGYRHKERPTKQFLLDELISACNKFYGDLFLQENKILDQRNYISRDWQAKVNSLLAQPWLNGAIKNNKAFLVRIGQHSGAEGVTLNAVRKIKIMKGSKNKPEFSHEGAITSWLASDTHHNNNNLIPFGWALVEVFDDSIDELPAWPDDCIEQSMTKWFEEVEQKQQDKQEKLREQQRLEREEQEKIKQAELEEKQQQQRLEEEKLRKQAEYEALSQCDKDILELKHLFEQLQAVTRIEYAKYESEINSLVNKAEQEISQWSPEARIQLANLLGEYYNFIGWFVKGANKNKKIKQREKKEKRIKLLRG